MKKKWTINIIQYSPLLVLLIYPFFLPFFSFPFPLQLTFNHYSYYHTTMAYTPIDLKKEEQDFQKEVAEIKKWWAEPRWRKTKRIYTAEDIAKKRGTLKIHYPSSQQADKLYSLLQKHEGYRLRL